MLAQQKVREHEQLYYTLVEATNTGYVRLDEAGRVVECNEEFLRLTGRSAPASWKEPACRACWHRRTGSV